MGRAGEESDDRVLRKLGESVERVGKECRESMEKRIERVEREWGDNGKKVGENGEIMGR